MEQFSERCFAREWYTENLQDLTGQAFQLHVNSQLMLNKALFISHSVQFVILLSITGELSMYAKYKQLIPYN